MIEKECPLNRDYYCDDKCKWYDNKHDDCKKVDQQWDIVEILIHIRDALYDMMGELNKND